MGWRRSLMDYVNEEWVKFPKRGRVSNIKEKIRPFFPLWDGCVNSAKNI